MGGAARWEWLCCIVVKASQVLQRCPVAQLVLVLGLHHRWSLGAKSLHRLEEIDHSLVPHPLQHDAEGDEHSGPAHPGTAVYSDWSVLAELLLGFVHLSDEIDEALSGFWHPLLWPVGELELADCSGLAIPGICDFELSQDVLGHVVLSHWIHHKVLVPG